MPYKDPEKRREYEREWRKKNGAKVREKARKFYHSNRENQVRRVKNYQERNKSTVLEYSRKTEYRGRKYGLARGEFEEMFAEQEGRCKLCGSPTDSADMHIDHDHRTGLVRGLLCRSCNAGLGMFHDNPEELRKAIAYIEKHYDRKSCRDARGGSRRESGLLCT